MGFMPLEENRTRLWQSALQRFCATYFVLLVFPFPTNYFPFLSPIRHYYFLAFNALISWSGRYIFHIPFRLLPNRNGTGDALYNYVQVFVCIVLSMILTTLWSVINKKSETDKTILNWFYRYIRFYFACTLMRYGVEKIIKAQFPFPYSSLDQPIGEMVPARLMWNFMGYSTVYNIFIGGSEFLAGFLVLFRKWTTVGVFLGSAVLLNVTILNFCYDVPVKLFALNLLFMSMFLATADINRITNFLFNKSIQPLLFQPRFKKQRHVSLWYSVKMIITFWILISIVRLMRYKYTSYGDGAFSKTPFFGIYQTEIYIKNKDTLLPLLSDTSQWKTLHLIYEDKAIIRTMSDSLEFCRFKTDTLHKTIDFAYFADTTYKTILHYSIPDSTHFLIKGKLKNDSISILLKKQNLNKYQLINRGFHWVNEAPNKQEEPE